MSPDEYIRSGICPSCKISVNKAPKPQKGEFIDTETITKKDLVRIDDWAIKIMNKHEHLFNEKVPRGKVLVQRPLKPEDVDIPQIYDFSDLHYEIFRDMYGAWAIRIMSGKKLIVNAAYSKT